MKPIYVDPLSASSLRIEVRFNETCLSSATGFTVKFDDDYFLVTNLHVVTGVNPETGQCLDKKHAGIPNNLLIHFHKKNELGRWVSKQINLFVDEQKLWKEHPLKEIDIILLPLICYEDVDIFTLDINLSNADIVASPAMPVSVIGYPLGLTAAQNWPIWKTGHIASDPDMDFEVGKPAFLIDATTKSGMSGSPVVLRLNGGYTTKEGSQIIGGGMNTKFMGVYSGRIHKDSDIGRVWKPYLINEIYSGKLIFDETTRRNMPSRLKECLCGSGKRFKHCCGSIF